MSDGQQEQCGQARDPTAGFSARRLIAGVLATSALLFAAASAAVAGVATSVTADPPGAVVVGQTNVPASVTIRNESSGAQATQDLMLQQITFVPSCGTLAILGPDCPLAAADLGVLGMTPTVVGEVATGCAGVTFTAGLIDFLQGKYELTPQTPIALGPVGSPTSACVVDFTFDAVKLPLLDANPAKPGFQTEVLASARAVDANGNHAGSYASTEITVNPGGPPIVPLVPSAAAVASAPPAAVPRIVTTAANLAAATPVAKQAVVAKHTAAHRRHHSKRRVHTAKRHARSVAPHPRRAG